jgi:putative acyl-CoA dehydrogenase
MAVALEASLMLRYGDPVAAELFCSSRLADGGSQMFGTLPKLNHLKSVIERHRPRFMYEG